MKKALLWILLIFCIIGCLFGATGILVGLSDSVGMTIFACVWTVVFLLICIKIFKNIKNLKLNKNNIDSNKIIPKSIDNESQNNNIVEKFNVHNNHQKTDNHYQVNYPKQKQNTPIAYTYDNQKVILLKSKLHEIQSLNQNDELFAVENQDRIVILKKTTPIGILENEQRSEMVKDWIKKEEPFSIYVKNVSLSPYSLTVFIAFYRDKRKHLAYRETSSFKLTNYRKDESQMVICCMNDTDEIELVESCDINGNDCVYAEVDGVEIGKLPKKISNRYFDEGAYACYFDYFEYEDEKDIYIPFVTIYW